MVGKSTRLHKDLRAHECVEFNGKKIGMVMGYIRTCGFVNVLNLMVGKSIGFHRDLRGCKC